MRSFRAMSLAPLSLLVLSILSLALASTDAQGSAGGIVSSETIVITQGEAAPDCVSVPNLALINGSFTGPAIRVKAGSTFYFTVINQMVNDSVSIHIHGLDQYGSADADGSAFVSALPIAPQASKTVTVNVDNRTGTFLYHGHIGLLDLHVYGAFIVESSTLDEPTALGYEEDRILLLSDFYHGDRDAYLAGLLDTPVFKFIGVPDAFLTNGKTIGTPNCTSSGSNSYDITTVEAGKTYRLRLIAAGSLFAIHFTIPGHMLTVIEIEGSLVEPVTVSYLELLPGQRYSVLLKADQPIGDYWIQQQGIWRAKAPKNGLSILRYTTNASTGISINSNMLAPASAFVLLPNETVGWINSQFTPKSPSLLQSAPAAASVTRNLFLVSNQVHITPATKLRWVVNNVSLALPQDGSFLLQRAMEGTLSALPADQQPTYSFNVGDVVDIVFQNTVAFNGVCEVHPWHIHGHSFWLVGSGAGQYPGTSYSLNMTDYSTMSQTPPQDQISIARDTASVYPSSNAYNQPAGQYGSPCGWQKVRVVANNPGVWPLHCHVASHFAMGMGVTFVVGLNQLQNIAPSVSAAQSVDTSILFVSVVISLIAAGLVQG